VHNEGKIITHRNFRLDGPALEGRFYPEESPQRSWLEYCMKNCLRLREPAGLN
jgi:hypothetical protein